MYTFSTVEVIHIPDQTRHSDKAMDITLYTFTSQSVVWEATVNTSATSYL